MHIIFNLIFYVLGLISWQEYHQYFLQKHGMNESYIKNHDKKHKGLIRAVKGMLGYYLYLSGLLYIVFIF